MYKYTLDNNNWILASDTEEPARPVHIEEEDENEDEEAPRPITKLPSFKKKQRDVDDEENARLEEVRREIREMKNGSPSRNADNIEDEDEGPVDPRQGMTNE